MPNDTQQKCMLNVFLEHHMEVGHLFYYAISDHHVITNERITWIEWEYNPHLFWLYIHDMTVSTYDAESITS